MRRLRVKPTFKALGVQHSAGSTRITRPLFQARAQLASLYARYALLSLSDYSTFNSLVLSGAQGAIRNRVTLLLSNFQGLTVQF